MSMATITFASGDEELLLALVLALVPVLVVILFSLMLSVPPVPDPTPDPNPSPSPAPDPKPSPNPDPAPSPNPAVSGVTFPSPSCFSPATTIEARQDSQCWSGVLTECVLIRRITRAGYIRMIRCMIRTHEWNSVWCGLKVPFEGGGVLVPWK